MFNYTIYIIDNIRNIRMDFHDFMCSIEAKIIKHANNLFQQQFKMRLH
jgi:hypothetical protein